MATLDQPPDHPKPRSRLEDEVLEILYRTDRDPTLTDRVQSLGWRARQRLRNTRISPQARFRLGALGWIVASVVLALLGALLSRTSGLLGFVFGLASVVCLILLWVPRGSGPDDGPKRWRGRDLDASPPGPPWLDDFRDRFRGPPRA